VITYVARNLEPYRGFHTFMRALPEMLRRRPKATVLVVGGDEVSYGRKPPKGTWREKMLAEIGDFDRSRVHFLGKLPYPLFLSMLQVSSVHIYLTVPFVLSWSLLEAMSSGCLIVASNTAPVREVMDDNINGLLVDFSSPAALAERVDEALTEREGLRKIRERARETVIERYDLATVCLPQQLALIEWLSARKTT
jgi:glycosyltransferase involved in cell wall biosynthesis